MKRHPSCLRGICLFVLLLVPASLWAAADSGREVTIGREFVLHSQVLREDRTYDLYLPPSYDRHERRTRYPVLYLLDGETFFDSFSSTVRYMSSGINANTRFPEMIVVALHNTDRNRDFTPTHSVLGAFGRHEADYGTTGGLSEFLRFMRTELIPHIEGSYRASGYRLLVGHSLAGLAVIHTLLTQPDLFNAYLSLDPSLWWDRGVELRIARQSAKALDLTRKQVFVATAGQLPTQLYGVVELHVPQILEAIKANRSAGLVVLHRHYANEDHGSVPLIAFIDGVATVFDGHKIDHVTYYDHPERIDAQFKRLSDRLGTELHPPESIMNDLGYSFLREEAFRDVHKALIYFQMNARNYPESFNVWDSLADGTLESGDRKLAATYYRKSLDLNPRNDHARQALEKLESP